MGLYMDELVRENARIARELRGVALLSVPHVSDQGWRMRRLALLRAEYPNCVTLSKEAEAAATTLSMEENKKNALMLLPSAREEENTHLPSKIEGTTGLKRPRTDDAIISVDPKVLKNRMTAVSSVLTSGGAGGHGGDGESYVPPSTWKMSKVLVGHRGWVWCTAVDPSNSWFATGGGDGVVKVWDLTTGALKLNLTGHKEGVRAVSLSVLSPYMFSGSDDHSVKCWDLERNEIIRDFHGHKGSVHCVSAHPSLDIVLSGGRDKTVRVWDVRTRSCVHLLVGHTDSVMSLVAQQADPQVVSGGSDGMIYLWDIAAGRALTRLTRHKKPVRGLAFTRQGTLASCGADHIRVWSLPSGEFLFNASTASVGGTVEKDHGTTAAAAYRWSCCAFSPRNILVAGSQEGKLALYDWAHARRPPYQLAKTVSLPGTLPGEGGINCVTFDASGSRMITAESDKSVKVWRAKE